MILGMSFYARVTVPLLFFPLLTQCTSRFTPVTNALTGPFDRRGNYVEEWADSPEKWYRPTAPSKHSRPTKKSPTAPAPPQITEVKPAEVKPRLEAAVSRPKPVVVKPKPKPTPKPKPKIVKYTVIKGDNLSRIAKKYGVGLSALRSANGISGNLIRPGQVLKIPK